MLKYSEIVMMECEVICKKNFNTSFLTKALFTALKIYPAKQVLVKSLETYTLGDGIKPKEMIGVKWVVASHRYNKGGGYYFNKKDFRKHFKILETDINEKPTL